MPIQPGTQITFVFDQYGCMRLEDHAQSLELLDLIDKNKFLQLVLGASVIPPNLTLACGDKTPPGNKSAGCINICPPEVKLKITQPLYAERVDILNESGCGGE